MSPAQSDRFEGSIIERKIDIHGLILMIEVGFLKLGVQKVHKFSLEDCEEKFNTAAEYAGIARAAGAILIPQVN